MVRQEVVRLEVVRQEDKYEKESVILWIAKRNPYGELYECSKP